MPKLTVTNSTSLNSLRNFANEAGAKSIRGKKDADGNIVLYTKTRKDRVLDRLRFRRQERRDNARQAVDTVFRNAASKDLFNIPDMGTFAGFVSGSQRSAAKAGIALKGVEVKAHIHRADALQTMLPVRQQLGPSLHRLGLDPKTPADRDLQGLDKGFGGSTRAV